MKTMKEYISTAEGMNQLWEKINEVLDNFDFSKVIVTMEALDWSWACTEGEADLYSDQGCRIRKEGSDWHYFPNIQQLQKRSRELIKECVEHIPDGENRWMVSTGGFEVIVDICKDEDREEYYGRPTEDDVEHSVDIQLRFIVEDSTSF